MLALLIRSVVAAAVAVFYRLERLGSPPPSGPLLLAANHPNSLLDPIIVFATAGRTSRPLAKAPLFDRPVIGRLIRAVGGIPVYRRQDDPGLMQRNEDTFRAAIDALHAGDAVQIFPEGRSHSDPSLSPLRTGAARIALAAEAAAGWSAGVAIVPIGLNYTRKAFFRGRAVALYGEPVPAAAFRDVHERDPVEAARALTAELERRLRDLTLNLSRTEDIDLVDTAERLWSREKGLATAREREPLAGRLPRLQAFARGLAWLRLHDPQRHARLEREVDRYRRDAGLLGAGEGDVPERYPLLATARWTATRAFPVLLLAPVALAAAVVWWPPYRLVAVAVSRMRLATDVTATYKLAASLIAYPVALVLWVGTLGWMFGALAAAAAVLVLPALGLLAVRWLDGFRATAEDLRLFLRVAGRRHARENLAERRRALVAEFEAVRALIGDGAADAAVDAARV